MSDEKWNTFPHLTAIELADDDQIPVSDSSQPEGEKDATTTIGAVREAVGGVGVPAGGSTGQVLKKASGADFDTEWANESGGGADDFTDLGDAPNSYTGHGGKVVAVKSGEDGLEFVTPSGGSNTPRLAALPAATFFIDPGSETTQSDNKHYRFDAIGPVAFRYVKLRKWDATPTGVLRIHNANELWAPTVTLINTTGQDAYDSDEAIGGLTYQVFDLGQDLSFETGDRFILEIEPELAYYASSGTAFPYVDGNLRLVGSANTNGTNVNGVSLRVAFEASGEIPKGVIGPLDPSDLRVLAVATLARPTLGPGEVTMLFDTTLGQPIWWTGTEWVDATGTTV